MGIRACGSGCEKESLQGFLKAEDMSQEEQKDKSRREDQAKGRCLWTVSRCEGWFEQWLTRGCWCASTPRGHLASLSQNGSTLPTDQGSEWLWASDSGIGIWQSACALDLARR